LLSAVGVPLILLLAAEGLFRLAGYGYYPHFFQKLMIQGRPVLTDNQAYGRRFFPPGLVRYPRPFTMPAVKPPGTLRIFVLGESAAMGDPDPKFGLSRMLLVLLRERFPNRRFEVVNAAMTAINSHVILPIAQDCAVQQGDLWIIYMGNNEMVGPFGCTSVFGARAPPLPLVRTSLLLKTTRIGQLLDAGLHFFRRGHQPLPVWGGMGMMADLKVSHDEPAVATVYRHFERNLTDVLAVGVRAHVPMLLCTVATNIKDCAPFGSLHRANLPAADLAEWQAVYDAGAALQKSGSLTQASAAFERAARIDGDFADLAFRRGQCDHLLGRDTEAASLFRQARDEDALQFRADGRINQMIRQAAAAFADRRVSLVDAEGLFATNSPHGLAGAEYFYEHVHLNPEGNYLLARSLAEQAAQALSLETPGQWVPEPECLRLLGLTDWSRYDALQIILDRVQAPPFTQQVDHTRQVERINEQLARYRIARKPVQVRLEARQVSEVVARQSEDADLRSILAVLLAAAGDNSGTESQWREAIALLPQAVEPRLKLAQLLGQLGRLPEAEKQWREVLRLDPNNADAQAQLSTLHQSRL
jgi:tetratricopeptide (TPR) repeat protein